MLSARGAFAIDNSSSYRMQAGVPLIVPEVNADAARPEDRIYPVANCTAIVLCVALALSGCAVGGTKTTTVTKNGKTHTYWRPVRAVRVGRKVRQEKFSRARPTHSAN